jgi:translation initiation factor IF-3
MSLVYIKSLGWSSIKMQHIRSSIKIQQNDHQFKMKSCITTLKHISKFNFALIMTKYDMEKPFFLCCSKGI